VKDMCMTYFKLNVLSLEQNDYARNADYEA
jgi:hypothetical protein